MISDFFIKAVNPFYKLTNTNLIILGNQKSGTTAIAKLLAESTGQSILADTPLLWEPNLSKLMNGSIDLKRLINTNKYYFSRQIIKEPNLTFLYNQLISIYPRSTKYIFIIRDPRDNIRSLLNRVNIPGDINDIQEKNQSFGLHEKILFDKKSFAYSSDHYVEQLAERWMIATETYFQFQQQFTLVRYEDFLLDKIEYINDLAKKLGFEIKKDISTKVDIQYQPRGNQEVSWLDFFGKENLNKINKICEDHLYKLGYNC